MEVVWQYQYSWLLQAIIHSFHNAQDLIVNLNIYFNVDVHVQALVDTLSVPPQYLKAYEQTRLSQNNEMGQYFTTMCQHPVQRTVHMWHMRFVRRL